MTLKAEKDNVKVKSNAVNVQSDKKMVAKPRGKKYEAEAEGARGTRARI